MLRPKFEKLGLSSKITISSDINFVSLKSENDIKMTRAIVYKHKEDANTCTT